jgi:hypothetical protein
VLLGIIAWAALLWSPATAVAASGPLNLEQPYVETVGRAEVGETLSCYPGAWEGQGVTYTYEWQRDGAALATGSTHQITSVDEGHWLSCVVSATDSEGTTTASSVDSFFINPPRQEPPRGGTIEGVVTDATGGQPIGGVKACAVNTDEAEPWDCVHTDASGRYKMTVAEAGHFIVEFTEAPHSIYVGSIYYGGKYSKSEASVLTVASGSTTTGVDVQLQEGGRITGTVTDALTGLPVEAVEVCARGEVPAECASTNDRGEYTVSRLASGSYRVEFGFGYGGSLEETYASPEYYKDVVFQDSEPAQVSVLAGATTTGINAEMHHWGTLTGRVTSASTHTPIEGVEVDAYDGSQHTAVTNANGEYTISHLGNRRDEYTVSFSPHSGEGLDFFPQWYDDKESQLESDPVHVSLDNTTSGIDAALSEGGQIKGQVTDAVTKRPLAEITVCAWSKVVYESRCAWTNSNGEYTIVRLPAEEFQVSFYTNADNYYSVGYSEPVAVTLGNATAGIDAAMEPVVEGTIMGSVREAVWAKAIPNINVCAYDVEQEELFGECTKSNSAGSYELRGLSAGEYLVEFSSPGPGLEYATQYYDKKPSLLYAEPIRVTEGKFISGIEGSLEKAGDASGEVTSAETGKPLKGIDACFYDFAEYLVGCVPTNEEGEYKTPPMAYGEYRVLFTSPPESGLNYAMQFYGGFASRFDSSYIDIKPGELTTGIDAQMTSGGSITGAVTDVYSAKGLEGALVCVLPPGFGELGACALTHAGGRYAIRGLDSGKYTVSFEAKGYKWQYYNDVELSSQAQPVIVSAGAASEDIDAALQPTADQPPSDLQPPTVSGNAAVGDVLECSDGSWTGIPAPSFTYSWLRNGHVIVGSGNIYRVQQADEGSSLQCEVTAENRAGSASVFSNPVSVPASTAHGGAPSPPPPPSPPPLLLPPPVLVPLVSPVSPPASSGTPPPTASPTTPDLSVGAAEQATPAASISTSSAVYTYSGRHGGAFVESGELVHCPAGRLPCQIIMEVIAKRNARKLLLASARLDVPAGEVEPLRFKLDAAGATLLRDQGHIYAIVVATMRSRDTKPMIVSHTVMLKSPSSRGRRP